MLKDRSVDVVYYFKNSRFRQENNNNDELNFSANSTQQTKPFFSEPYQVAQYLKKPTKLNKMDCSSFIFNNFTLLIFILIGYSCSIIISHMILKFADHKFKKWKEFKINSIQFLNLSFNKQRFLSSKVSLICFFYSIFLFIILFLLSTTIKTDKIVINTDEFVVSAKKIIEVNKTMIYLEKDSYLFEKAPNGSLFHKIYNKRFKESNSSVGSQSLTKMNKQLRPSEYFIFSTVLEILTFLVALFPYISDRKNEFIFIKSTIYYEDLNTVVFLKNLEEDKKRMINFR